MRLQPLISLIIMSGLFAAASHGQDTANTLDETRVQSIAQQNEINATVLQDYVDSYNFKCPQELEAKTLEILIDNRDDYSELTIMLETYEKDWRDLYVETRAGISCLTDGFVSNAY